MVKMLGTHETLPQADVWEVVSTTGKHGQVEARSAYGPCEEDAEAGAEAKDSRSRWSHPPGTATGRDITWGVSHNHGRYGIVHSSARHIVLTQVEKEPKRT